MSTHEYTVCQGDFSNEASKQWAKMILDAMNADRND